MQLPATRAERGSAAHRRAVVSTRAEQKQRPLASRLPPIGVKGAVELEHIDREPDRRTRLPERTDEEVVPPTGGDDAGMRVYRLEDDAGVVRERWDQGGVRGPPASFLPRPALARELDDPAELSFVNPIDSDAGERAVGALEIALGISASRARPSARGTSHLRSAW